MSPLEDCCYTCGGCGRIVCGENEVSPGEVEQLCPDCYEIEDPSDGEAAA